MMIEEFFRSKKQPNRLILSQSKPITSIKWKWWHVLTRKLEEIGSKKLSLLLAVKNGLDRCANSFVTLSKSIKEPEPEIELWRGPIQVFFCKKSIADLVSICSLKMQLNLAESIILLYNMFNFSKATYHGGFRDFCFSPIILLIKVLT